MTTLFRRRSIRRSAMSSLFYWLAVADIRISNRWASLRQRREDIHNALITTLLLAGLLLAYGIVGAMDYEDVLIAEARAQEDGKERYRLAVQSCLNNGSFYYPDTKEAFECSAKPLGRQ